MSFLPFSSTSDQLCWLAQFCHDTVVPSSGSKLWLLPVLHVPVSMPFCHSLDVTFAAGEQILPGAAFAAA